MVFVSSGEQGRQVVIRVQPRIRPVTWPERAPLGPISTSAILPRSHSTMFAAEQVRQRFSQRDALRHGPPFQHHPFQRLAG